MNYGCSLSCDRTRPRPPHGVAAAAGARAGKGGSGAVADGVARDRCRWVEHKKPPDFEGYKNENQGCLDWKTEVSLLNV